ncbi:MAG TPA: hypothetical protein VNQ56_00395 [Pseudolabrys sp.]|nr:hypothetical protein [Pseudolabrys sp.]
MTALFRNAGERSLCGDKFMSFHVLPGASDTGDGDESGMFTVEWFGRYRRGHIGCAPRARIGFE